MADKQLHFEWLIRLAVPSSFARYLELLAILKMGSHINPAPLSSRNKRQLGFDRKVNSGRWLEEQQGESVAIAEISSSPWFRVAPAINQEVINWMAICVNPSIGKPSSFAPGAQMSR